MRNKPWYIWFSLPAFAILWFITALKFFFRDVGSNNDPFGQRRIGPGRTVLIALLSHIYAIPVMGLPVLGVLYLCYMAYERLSESVTAMNIALLLVLYGSGVFANYLLSWWCKKNLSEER